MPSDPSAPHQHAAETVRRHLVALRGGAPFLSPADAAALVSWLDQGVPVAHILIGLEKAAEHRQARKIRAPLALTHARRHLRVKPSPGPVSPAPAPGLPASPGLSAIAQQLRAQAPRPQSRAARLAQELDGLSASSPEDLAAEAIAAAGRFFDALWLDLPDDDRAAALAEAAEDLGDLSDLLDAPAFVTACEERARAALRRQWPSLSAAHLWESVCP